MSDGAYRVLLVGHCGPDAYMLRTVAQRALPGAQVSFVNDDGELGDALGGASLLLVNRVLDGRFAASDGVELIRSLAGRGGAPPSMLVSNYAEAQARAEAAGAVPGFGKSEAYAPGTAARIRAAVGAEGAVG